MLFIGYVCLRCWFSAFYQGDHHRWGRSGSKALQTPSPSQVIGQVFGRDAMEAGHPALQAAVVGVGALDMQGPVHDPNAGAEIDGHVGDVWPLGETMVGGTAIGVQHDIGVEDGRRHGGHGIGVGFWQHRVGRGGAAVAHDQRRDLLAGQAALAGRGRWRSPL